MPLWVLLLQISPAGSLEQRYLEWRQAKGVGQTRNRLHTKKGETIDMSLEPDSVINAINPQPPMRIWCQRNLRVIWIPFAVFPFGWSLKVFRYVENDYCSHDNSLCSNVSACPRFPRRTFQYYGTSHGATGEWPLILEHPRDSDLALKYQRIQLDGASSVIKKQFCRQPQ